MTHPAASEAVTSPVPPGDWVADPAACSLAFAVRNFAVRTVTGQIPLLSAVVHVSPDGVPASVRAELDARGLRTGNVRRDNDLRGRRFLATDRWPVIRFEADLITPAQDAWTVSGTLTVKDTPGPVRLDVASFTIPADGPAQLDLRATGQLDRRSAGVSAGPAFLIGHQITLSLAVRLRHTGPPR
jgi:polyisoprenoid-binding protein YceI